MLCTADFDLDQGPWYVLIYVVSDVSYLPKMKGCDFVSVRGRSCHSKSFQMTVMMLIYNRLLVIGSCYQAEQYEQIYPRQKVKASRQRYLAKMKFLT